MHLVTGNIHIHSSYSDGAATIPDIAAAAAKVGLDYIIVTDHQTLAGLPEEGYHHGVLVLVGTEINRTKHHYLALGISREIADNDQKPQTIIDAVNQQGGLGFIAHPFEKGSPFVLDGITYPWHDWNAQGFAGIEVWNWCSQWRDGIQKMLKGLFYAYFKPEGPISGPCPQALERFDQITQKQKITAIAGSDAHNWRFRYGLFQRCIFPYEYLFRTANNSLLLEEPLSQDAQAAKKQILTALRTGRAYIINHLVGKGESFSFFIANESGVFNLGDTATLTANTTLSVRCPFASPRHLSITILRNGTLWRQEQSNRCAYQIKEKGTYRVEIRQKKKPWIFTNPIYVV